MKNIGIDLGGHTISAALAEIDGGRSRIYKRIGVPTPEARTLKKVADKLADIVEELAAGEKCRSIGIGLPGFIDKGRRVIKKLTNFPIAGVDFVSLMENALENKKIKLKVFIENDANCAALGEGLSGAARGCRDYMVFTLGTGIGTGIVIDGKLLLGSNGIAGEGGHVSVAISGTCGCGAVGHAETLAGADGIERAARAAGLPDSFKELWERRNEEKISAIIQPAMDVLARCIASAAVVTDPEKIILNGGMSRADGIAGILRERVTAYLPLPFRPNLDVRVSELGGDAALYGAASLGLQWQK